MSLLHHLAADKELGRCILVAAERFGADYAPRTLLSWDQRGQAAGTYRPKTRSLHLNPQLFAFDVSHTIETTGHEYAHAVGHVFYLKTKLSTYLRHGAGWASIMDALGHPPEIRHTLPLARSRAVRRFVMGCPCGVPHALGIKRYARHVKALTAGLPGYRCAACKGPLTLIREELAK